MIELPAKKMDQLRALLSALPDSMTVQLRVAAEHADPDLAALLRACLGDDSQPDDTAAFEAFFKPLQPVSQEGDDVPPSRCYTPVSVQKRVWDWMLEDQADGLLDDVSAIIERPNYLDQDLDQLRHGFSEKIKAELGKAAEDPRYEKRLRSNLLMRDFRNLEVMASLLRCAPILRRALKDVPLALDDIPEDLSIVIRDQYDWSIDQDPEAGVWVLAMIMARLVKPWRLFRVFERITKREDDLLASQTDMSHIGDALLADAEYYLSGFASVPTDMESSLRAIEALEAFSAISVGMTREIGIRKDGAWGKRLFALRDKASQNMTRIHYQARTCIEATLPEAVMARKRRASERPEYARAEALAVFLGRTKNDAGRAAVGSVHNSLISDLAEMCDSAGEAILSDLRNNGSKDPEASETRVRQIAAVLDGLGYPEDAAILVRRTVAALAA